MAVTLLYGCAIKKEAAIKSTASLQLTPGIKHSRCETVSTRDFVEMARGTRKNENLGLQSREEIDRTITQARKKKANE